VKVTFQNYINGLQCRFIGASEQRGESIASGPLTSNQHSQDGGLPGCKFLRCSQVSLVAMPVLLSHLKL